MYNGAAWEASMRVWLRGVCPWETAKTFQILIRQSRDLYREERIGSELAETAYAQDSTTIDRRLNRSPWARFCRTKAAVELDTLVYIRGPIPVFTVSWLDLRGRTGRRGSPGRLLLKPEAFYLMDCGHVDFRRLYGPVSASAFFVTRSNRGMRFKRRDSGS